jgi:diamine N-acetyltransferase
MKTTSSPIVLRSWTPADIEDVRRITWETWVDAYSSFIPLEDLKFYFDDVYSADKLKTLQHAAGVTGFVATCSGEIAGYLKTHYEEAEKRFYVSSVYVLPRYQGMGVGGALMRAAEEQALATGRNEVWLGVMVENAPALAWYRKMGFQFTEEAPFTMGKTTVMHLIGSMRIADRSSHTTLPLREKSGKQS